MTNKSVPSTRIISADDEGVEAFYKNMALATAGLRPGETLSDFAARGPDVIRENVVAIHEALERVDAFDVIELMRLRETPFVLDGYRESLADQMPAAVELIAFVLLSRGERIPEGVDTRNVNPAAGIQDFHDRCNAMLSVGQFMLLSEGRDERYGPLTSLAAMYVGHDINVKFKQYAHVHDALNEALFATEHLGDLLLDSLGFSYEDFIAVRTAIREVYLDRLFFARDTFGEIVQEWSESGRTEQPEARIDQGRAAAHDLMFFPGRRASFTASDIAGECDVDIARVEQVLQRFSVPFGAPMDPVAAVESFLAGDSPFRNAALVVDNEGNYISLNVPIGTDCFRQVVEAVVKTDTAKWKRYEKRRVTVSEQLAVEHLQTLLGTRASHVNLKYFRPNEGIDVTQLGAEAVKITSIAEQTEADALFLVEDVAICVEVKGRSISHQARGGHVQRLAGDLRATVGDATDQAFRLERLIRANGGLWVEGQQWLDLTSIREIRSVAVCLDDMGPLATALDELVRADVIKSERFPWIVSLHDLAIVAEVVDRPAEFLLYLRRRTESEVSLNFAAIDELDLFMLFLSGQLYVEPDPDRVSEEFLGVRRPTTKDRRRYRDQAVPTQVMTHTDPLDSWVYFREGSSQEEVPKPKFSCHAAALRLVDFLQDGKKPGWFRFAADLLNLAEEAQEDVARRVNEMTKATKKDGQPHTLFIAFAGTWGYPALFFGSKPRKMSHALASEHLVTYGIAKKHQIQSDRALMVLIDEQGSIRSVRYDHRLPSADSDLDQLTKEMRLIPVEIMGRTPPPSARRATKRLNPGKKRRKRR